MSKLLNKETFKLTERGLFWLKIDLANTFGNDKMLHEEQIEWFDDNIKHILDNQFKRNIYIAKAESPFEFEQVVENYEMYLRNEPVNGLMHVDCSNQALQIYAVLTGDLKTAKVCNLAGENVRADGYQMLADSLNTHFSESFITRKDTKKPMMTTLYGKQKAWESMHQTLQDNLEKTDVKSEDFQESMNEIFKESMHDIAPNAMDAMDKIQALNNENIGVYHWTMPDGFKVQYDVKSETLVNVERITKSGINIHIEDIITEYKPNKYNAGMAPNVIHSFDGYIARQIIRLSDYFITIIHDDFACHYNFTDNLISNYKNVMINLLENDYLNHVLYEISNGRNFILVKKNNSLTSSHILNSKYGLT